MSQISRKNKNQDESPTEIAENLATLSKMFSAVGRSRLYQQRIASVAGNVRMFSVTPTQLGSGGHHHAPAKSQETLQQALAKRFPGKEEAVSKRLSQLKRNHSKL